VINVERDLRQARLDIFMWVAHALQFFAGHLQKQTVVLFYCESKTLIRNVQVTQQPKDSSKI
jgi:hypothetical protein